jgi:chromosomal replication initiator protein
MDESGQVLRISFPHAFFGRWFMESIKPEFERRTLDFFQNAVIIYDGPGAQRTLAQPNGQARLKKDQEAAFAGQGPRLSPSVEAASQEPHGAASPQGASPGNGGGKTAADIPWRRNGGAALSAMEHSFTSFLTNRKNDLPLAAARECVYGSSDSCTPFVLYGQGGVGKSHLLGAMAWACSGLGKAFFFGSIEFLEHVDLSSGNYFQIREQAVFLDDIQRIAAFPRLQDALIALIDSLCAAKKLLALTCDVHPSHCRGLSPKLRSRLNSGLVMEVKRPDLDIRTRYVQLKNKGWGLELDKETVLAIAGRYPDIRNIDGFLAKLRFARSLVAEADAMEMLNRDSVADALSAGLIIKRTADYFALKPEDLVGKSRDGRLVVARNVAILLCKELLGLSHVRIGRSFGGRNHSSIYNSIKKITMLQDSDKDVHKAVQEVKHLCLNQR